MKWDQCFLEICNSLFKVTATSSAGTFSATGFVVAKYKKADKLGFVLATAGHTFRKLPANENIYWVVQKFDWKGSKIEEITFGSNLEAVGNSPIRVHLELDIALLFIPNIKSEVKLLRIINPSYGIQPGGKVGWAGFPTFVKEKTETPHPCYFEGVVSAVVDKVEKEGKLFYLVDGHGGKGVSGGPLWCWNDEQSTYEVIGICRQYLKSQDKATPGLVVFESINPIIKYLKTSNELEISVIN